VAVSPLYKLPIVLLISMLEMQLSIHCTLLMLMLVIGVCFQNKGGAAGDSDKENADKTEAETKWKVFTHVRYADHQHLSSIMPVPL